MRNPRSDLSEAMPQPSRHRRVEARLASGETHRTAEKLTRAPFGRCRRRAESPGRPPGQDLPGPRDRRPTPELAVRGDAAGEPNRQPADLARID